MIKIKPKDKVTLDKINLYKEKFEMKDEIFLEDYENKNITSKYEVLLPIDSILLDNTFKNKSVKYVYNDVEFVFSIFEKKKLNINNYLKELEGNENIQILKNESFEVVKYREVMGVTRFYSIKIFEYEECTILAQCSCNNDKSMEWERVFIEILNSVKEI